MDTRTFIRDGYVVTLDFTGERPTVTYNDGPTHRLHNEDHADGVITALLTVGYSERNAE
jgi:hypothetical protein